MEAKCCLMGIARLAAVALVVWSSAAMACTGQITAGAEPTLTYRPFDAAGAIAEQRVTIRNTGPDACVFQLSFVRLDMAGQGLGGLAFEVLGGAGETLAASAPAPVSGARLISRVLAPDESFDFVYALSLPPGQMTPPGDHEQAVELQLLAAADARSLGGAVPLDRRRLRLGCHVPRTLSINIRGAGTRKTIDFGTLTEGETKHVVIATRSNQPFVLEATSLNGGAMAMAPPLQRWRVPYAMALDGAAVAFPARIGPFGGSTLAGHEFDVVFTIGDVANKRAGLYADEITIEIKPAI